ncbi:MAG: FHA domain-containing protein, partial [Candidatus Eremiobacterota bacterium]
NIDIEKYISPAEEKKIDEHLKVYDTGLTGLITGKKSVDETEMTQLLTGRVPLYGAYLIIYDREGNSKRISLKNKNITVGRTDSSKKDVDINLAFYDPDKKVSRKHAEIFQTGEGDFYIKDSGSSNGTYLNKKELDIHKEYILKDGDEILFGKTKAIFAK